MKKEIAISICALFLASCGQDRSGSISSGERVEGTGSIKAVVANSRSFNPNISHGQILRYKVTVSGGEISEPIVAEFDGDADSGVINGVPVGGSVQLKAEAVNLNEMTIREGETGDIEVVEDETAAAEVRLEAVPIFANLYDGNNIPNTRFRAVVFSEPGSSVIIDDELNGDSIDAFDPIIPDVATGLAGFTPPLLSPGEHRLTVRDAATGRRTTVTVNITDGTKIKAAPFFSGSSIMSTRLGRTVAEF